MFERLKEDYLFHFSRVLNEVLVKPDMLQIMLTSKCNLRCKMCGVWNQEFESEMTTDEVKGLIDQAIDFGIKMIYFTGGEALLRKDIFELIDHATRPGVIATINTNGSVITKDMAYKIVSSKLQSLCISIDSPVAETHDHIRGEGVFEKAMVGIGHVNDLRRELGRDRFQHLDKALYLSLTTVIMKPNLDQLVEMVDLAERMEFSSVSFQPLISNDDLLKSKGYRSELSLDEKDIVKLESVLKTLSKIKAARPDFRLDLMPEKTIQHYRRERYINTCFAGYNRIFVNPHGDISFVCFDVLGNIKTDRLEDAWLSAKAYENRKKIKACKACCTQFCSEREDSDSIRAIHEKVLQQGEDVISAEHVFLLEMVEKIEQHSKSEGEDLLADLDEVKGILRGRDVDLE